MPVNCFSPMHPLTPATSDLFLAEQGEGPALLLIHGLLMGGAMFRPVCEHWRTHYRVLMPDLRGYAHSKHLPPPYTVAQHAADLAALLQRLGLQRAVVLGYSQGGTVAQQLTLDYPDLMERLILACTFAYNRATWREQLEGVVMPWLVRWLRARQIVGMMTGLTRTQMHELEAIVASNERPQMVAATRALLAFDSRPRLSEIVCPTLVITGGRDQAVPPHHGQQLASSIPGAVLTVIKQGSHALLWTHADEFVQAVDAFLHGV
jgi:3-oxoadipate enol-lactonase